MTDSANATETTGMDPRNVQPARFIGNPEHDASVVMRRFFVCVNCELQDKRSLACVPLEEIPLLRVLYRLHGGKIVILGKAQDEETTDRLREQELNAWQWQNVLRNYMKTYAKVAHNKQVHEIFNQVYGSGADCTLIPKMHAMAEEWNGSYDPRDIEALLAKHFPHVSATSQRDTIDLPGKELGAPTIGARSGEGPDPDDMPTPPAATEPHAWPAGSPEAERPVQDEMLTAFLLKPENTDGDPLSEEQAVALSILSVKKPPEEWSNADIRSVTGMTGVNRKRLVRLVGTYYQKLTPEGFQSDGSAADILKQVQEEESKKGAAEEEAEASDEDGEPKDTSDETSEEPTAAAAE